MADRLKMLRAVARQVAAERASDAPAPRPPSARIPLPRDHELDLALGTVHAVRVTAPGIDVDRFAAALRAAAAHHDALRLHVVRDSGRSFLASVDEPVALTDELDQADPSHPVRWSAAGDTITVAISAYLMDRSCWGRVLATVQAAYHGETPASAELEYGDYCYWLAHRGEPEAIDIGHPEPEPYWAFAADQPWSVVCRPVPVVDGPRAGAFDELTPMLANAFFDCGWQTAGIRVQQWKPRSPETPIVGRVDQPVVGVVRRGGGVVRSAPSGAVADAVDAWWASFTEPLVQLDVDVLDLPSLRFDGEPATVEPVLRPSQGWQCLLVRQPGEARLYLAGAEPTLPPLHAAYAGELAEGNIPSEAPSRPLTGKGHGHGDGHGDVRAPGIVTPLRTLSADVVEAASERRADELRDAGVEPGSPLVIEAIDGPETIANLIAALKCRADVLLLDMDDPLDWRESLLSHLPGAARVSSDNTVHAGTSAPIGDGEGALLLGLSSAPGKPVMARVPLDGLVEGAAGLGEMWKGRACVIDAARGGEDLVLKILACAMYGADVLLAGNDGREAVELLIQVPDCCVEQHQAAAWSAPLHQLTDLTWLRRGTDATDVTANTVTRWWVAEAPAAQWLATERGLRLRSGSARLTDAAGRSMPEATIGRLATRVPNGSRYVGDPRRTAEEFRPGIDGGRELWTATVAANVVFGPVAANGASRGGRQDVDGALATNRGPEIRVLRYSPDRVVDRNRTCLTDALRAVAPGAFVGVQPSVESGFVVSPQPVDTGVLPRPLAQSLVRVDPAATGMDFVQAWRSVQARADRHDDGEPEDWASAEEAALAKEVVEPVLGMPVRRNDDLFSLGATSLQLMRVLLQVKERFGVEVPLARFFAAPSVRVLSELIRQTSDPAAAALEVLQGIEGEDP